MIYSVWNDSDKLYHYYDGPDPSKDIPAPQHLISSASQIGVPADNASWPLPKNAVMTGKGPQARGMIATIAQPIDWKKWLLIGGAGILLLKVL
jgi:hypothetical protein